MSCLTIAAAPAATIRSLSTSARQALKNLSLVRLAITRAPSSPAIRIERARASSLNCAALSATPAGWQCWPQYDAPHIPR